MFNRIFGMVSEKKGQTLLLRSGNIEWEVQSTTTSISKLPGTDQEAAVYTYLHHREDQLALYGFATEDERKLFFELIKVTGIGPKQACRILSNISDRLLLEALNNEDVDALAALPGLGKKTAQKIILALRGKLSSDTREENPYIDIIEALGNMGFDRVNAKKVVAEIGKRPDLQGLDKEEAEKIIMKEAIVGLSK